MPGMMPMGGNSQQMNNPMMVAPRDKNFKDAQTSYSGGMVNTQTQGLNPYVQFAPNRMDQMGALMGMRRPQPQMAPRKLQHDEGNYGPQKAMQLPEEQTKQVPILGRNGTVLGYGTAQPGSASYSRSAQTFGM